MRHRFGLLGLALSSLILALAGAPPASSAASGSALACTQTATTTTTTPAGSEGPPTSPPASPSPGSPCWVEVDPYPFGSEGIPVETPGPVETTAQQCSVVLKEGPPGSQCALTVTSMAFRAWNRGLAATDTGEAGTEAKNPYGVWLFNGVSWLPSPGFPGYNACPGHTVVWAGKLDYWLIGGPTDLGWSRLCRFDGATLEWEALELPEATLARVVVEKNRRVGGITSASCLAWNDCWFFGTYGTVVHWDGTQLVDASPYPSLGWLQGEYTAAVTRQDAQGNPFGVAVGATAERYEPQSESEVLPEHEGAAPPQMRVSSGGPFSPVPFAPPTSPQGHDPYRTDLVAVDFDAAGEGWVAGNPAGLRAWSGSESRPASPRLPPPPSPLVPVSVSGASTTCQGPPAPRFTFTPPTFIAVEPLDSFPDSFLWSSIAVIPGANEALAGGTLRPHKEGATGDLNAEPVNEPVITRAACDGETTVTRFRVEDPTYSGSSPKPLVPADREAYVTTIAANAPNDAWAAVRTGTLFEGSSSSGLTPITQPPHLYRLTDGAKPDEPEGNDLEERPLELQLDAAIVVLEPPPPPPPPPPPATVTQTRRVKLPPAIFDVKAKLHRGHHLSLYLSFRVRRPITLGAQAIRRGHVVSEARPRYFAGRTGLLILALNRKRWPTKVRLVP
jgi:hypothetical protein